MSSYQETAIEKIQIAKSFMGSTGNLQFWYLVGYALIYALIDIATAIREHQEAS